jgi:hypothetical protein
MQISWAEFSSSPPPFLQDGSPPTGRRRTGLKYEAQVHVEFERRYPALYTPAPWVRYRKPYGTERWCQPDGLLIDPKRGQITVIEVKLQHTADAARQLFDLYIPLMEHLFSPLYRLAGCEVVRWYDGTLPTAMRPVLCADPVRARSDSFNVHIFEGF